MATSAPFFPRLPGGLVCLVVGRGGQSPQGVIELSSAFFPASLAARWRSVWLCVLTASQLPWWPQGCKPHLPTVAKPAEGQATRQAQQQTPTPATHKHTSPPAHTSCRCSGEGEGRHMVLIHRVLQRPDTCLCPPLGFPSYLATKHRWLKSSLASSSLAGLQGTKGAHSEGQALLRALGNPSLILKTTLSPVASQPPTRTSSHPCLRHPPHLPLLG